jgi:threonine aldolase
MKIDLRSDTVTKPTAGMLDAMMSAEVGDDVFSDDPTVSKLEAMASELFGMEAALFCASGTMTNQLSIKTLCPPGSEIICDQLSHIYLYEGGGVAVNAQSSLKLLEGDYGRINANQIEDVINNPADIHLPISRMVSLENTMNKGGGAYYDFSEIYKIKDVCQKNNLYLHLDGARLFNAIVETDDILTEYGNTFDSISICLSKGLGCPVGSLLLGKKDFITKARRNRKVFGGGWRQAGLLAAAGIYALENNIDRLTEDHQRAKLIGHILSNLPYVKNIYPISTNIVIFEPESNITSAQFVQQAASKGILCVPFGKKLVRFVTHLDFDDDQLDTFEEILKELY